MAEGWPRWRGRSFIVPVRSSAVIPGLAKQEPGTHDCLHQVGSGLIASRRPGMTAHIGVPLPARLFRPISRAVSQAEAARRSPRMTAIVDIVARQILDSRGNPTVEVDVVL